MRHVRLLCLLLLIALAGAVDRAQAQTTFIVDTLGNVAHGACAVGACTLADAIVAANANAGADTIAFSIAGGGVQTILLDAALPAVAEAVVIDGYTQPGAAANTNATGGLNGTLLIEISGTPAYFSRGLAASSAGPVTIRGLVFNGFINDIELSQGSGHKVEGCYLGTTPDGTAKPSFSSDRGILVDRNTDEVTIGGTLPAHRNLISGHGIEGIRLDADDQRDTTVDITGNLIGTNAAGDAAVANGVGVTHVEAGGLRTHILRIGGATDALGNVISGNGDGIWIERTTGAPSGAITIQKNRVGIRATTLDPVPNTDDGVVVTGLPVVTIVENWIVGNQDRGVTVIAGLTMPEVNLRGNLIYGNGNLGIDLGDDGRTANDADDADTGVNDLQNFPVLTRVTNDGLGNTRFEGILNSTPGLMFRVEFFRNNPTDRSGMDARELLFSELVPTNGSGLAVIDLTKVMSLPVGDLVTMTATNGNGGLKTSEISDAAIVRPAGHRIDGHVTINGSDLAGVTLTLSGTAAASTTTSADGLYEIDGLATGSYTITPTLDGYTFTPASSTINGLAADETRNFTATAVPLTYTVNSTNHPGNGVCDLTECTLNEAMEAANAHPGPDTIAFAIAPFGGRHTIVLATQLPPITDPLLIDGFTQPGATPNTNATGGLNANLMIEIDGNNHPFGLAATAGPATIRGLIIRNFSLAAVAIGNVNAAVNDVTIAGNYIGVGATAPGTRAGYSGVFVLTNVHNAIIGGTTPAARNVISNWGGPGISLFSGAGYASQVKVLDNLIGTSIDGATAVPNQHGVSIMPDGSSFSADFQIGGDTAAERNVISGNEESGIMIDYRQGAAFSTDVQLTNNQIGVAADGVSPLGNGGAGIAFLGSPRSVAARNEIAHNGGAGILVDVASEGARVRLTENVIYQNTGLAIDLGGGNGGNGRTPNDALDTDTGSNNLQNFPAITAAQAFFNGTAEIEGRLESSPESTFIVELFATGGSHTPGAAARRYLGAVEVTTDDAGIGLYSFTASGVAGGDGIAGTATNDLNQTSELGDAFAVAPVPVHTISGTVTFDGGPLANITIALQGAATASTTTDAAGHYAFAGLPEGGSFTIVPASLEYGFTPPQAEVAALAADTVRDFTAVWLSRSRFLTEGATGSFWQTRVSIMNPTQSEATGEVRFMRADGAVTSLPLTLGAHRHTTIDPSQVAGFEQAAFATEVRSIAPLVASRSTVWGTHGELGAHAEQAIDAPRQSWYFGEGATGCFSLFYMLQNASATAADVDIEFVRRAPAAPILQHYTIAPFSRFTLPVHEVSGLENAEVSARIDVKNGVPVLAGRAMYSSCSGQTWRGGHASSGSPAPATSWFLAEGATGSFFDLYVLIANFEPTDAEVDVTYLLADGRTITRPHTIPARSRVTIDVVGEDPALAQAEVSTRVVSKNHVPVVVERAQWWPHDNWHEGHSSAGTTETGVEWQLAGVELGGPHESASYLLIANTGDADGQAQVRLLFDDGTTAELVAPVTVRAHSRTTVALADAFPAVKNQRFGIIVTSQGVTPAPLVVELSTYGITMNGGVPVFWGAGTNTVATRVR